MHALVTYYLERRTPEDLKSKTPNAPYRSPSIGIFQTEQGFIDYLKQYHKPCYYGGVKDPFGLLPHQTPVLIDEIHYTVITNNAVRLNTVQPYSLVQVVEHCDILNDVLLVLSHENAFNITKAISLINRNVLVRPLLPGEEIILKAK